MKSNMEMEEAKVVIAGAKQSLHVLIAIRSRKRLFPPIWRAEAWSLEKVLEPAMERRHRHLHNPKSPKRKMISKQEMEEQKLKIEVEDEDERLELVK
ncbi:hypothetical protein Pyn_12744 [Prunus yedoensis var. nudiflora]|uniref:Uncharacterized protein n=1 Tax=Prunus yedoensis var. nudiflora TaxID=2094558 RepID=A0A314XIN9_PRUYE|nr:hypothetical protein Pyn_12744 [Prunus yedoensis var. nudiflora]